MRSRLFALVDAPGHLRADQLVTPTQPLQLTLFPQQRATFLHGEEDMRDFVHVLIRKLPGEEHLVAPSRKRNSPRADLRVRAHDEP